MAEPLFAAAFAAGVLEGGSILWSAQGASEENDDNDKSSSPPHVMIGVSSLLYGTAALPASVIGASPGPSILSRLPYCPPLLVEVPEHAKASEATNENDSGVAQERASESGAPPEEKPMSQVERRSELIRRAREENRKLMASVKQQRAASKVVSRSKTPSVPLMNRYFSTLDGRPLSTPLAEGMRRARILLVGAGLVATIFSYQSQKSQEINDQTASDGSDQPKCSTRNDSVAVKDYVKGHPGGTAIRLMNEPHNGIIKNTVPFVYGNPSICSNDTSQVFWRLGRSPDEWKQLPITKDWLIRPSHSEKDGSISSEPFLVVESDISLPFCDNGLDHQSFQPGTLESTRFMSRVIETAIGGRADTFGSIGPLVVSIIIGSEELLSETRQNEIYVDGRAAFAKQVENVLEELRRTNLDEGLQPDSDGSDAEVEAESEGDNAAMTQFMSYFDFVGEKIRHGGASVLKVASKLVARGDNKIVHLYTDSQEIAAWLLFTMPTWTVVWHDVSERNLVDAAFEHDGLSVVCCSSDVATSMVVTESLRQANGVDGEVLAIFQHSSSQVSLKWLAGDASCLSTISVENYHESLFSEIKRMLKSGKTPHTIQELMNERA